MPTSIKPKFIPSKLQGKAGVICIQLICKRKVKLIRTGFRIFPTEWDKQKRRVSFENSEMERRNYLQSIKSGLAVLLQQWEELIRLFEARSNYTLDELAALFASRSFNGYFFTFIDFVVKNLRENNRKKTATICITAKNSLEHFLCGEDVLLDQIDNDLMRKYDNYLKTRGVVKNTASCYMRALRAVYNKAVQQGLTSQKNPFARIFTGIDKTVKRAVCEELLIELKNLDLSSQAALALARDLFLFSFYMRGISFIDMANLKKNNLKNGYIVYFRSKTKQMLTIKIEDCMQQILSRYESQTIDDYLLPIYNDKNHDHISHLRTYNKRLKRISDLLGIEKPLSSYVSRHTWATVALRKGIPIEVISEGMGHDSEATTRIYLASLEQSVVDRANAEIIKIGK